MKCIDHENLCKLLPTISGIKHWDIDDFKRLLDEYGDDWYAEGWLWARDQRNGKMENFLKELNNNV